MESDSNQDVDDSLNLFVRKKNAKSKKKASSKKGGRKAMWSQSLLSDLVDIIISSEYYKKKLIFTNTKNQKNGEIYAQVLVTLKERASERGEKVPFTNIQLCTKFKKAIAECKKAALTIKTVTGIKRFIEEKSYGTWFNDLFSIVKTCEACRPELAIEPSSSGGSVPDSETGDTSSSSAAGIKEKFEIPKLSKKRKDDPVVEAIGLIKNVTENDPMKDMISYLREEAEKAGEHELKILEIVAQQPATQQPTAYVGPLSWQYGNQDVQSSSMGQYEGGYGSHDMWSYTQ